MAAIKHNLQRDVFKPSEERLYAVVSVTKVGKKKKASFLCVADGIHSNESIRAQQHSDEGSEAEDYQELTQREENDLEHMISQTENAISHIETFTEQLSKDLSVLDGLLNDALKELDHLDTRLTGYDTLLRGVRAQMEQMEDKDKHMVTESKNRRLLMEEVESLVGILNIPEHNLTVLQKADLSKGKGLKESTHAAFTVLRALETELSPGLTEMRAVKEQREKFLQISSDFAQSLKSHLIDIFQHHAYSQSLSKVYERELREFFEAVKQRTLPKGVKTYSAFRMTGSAAVNDPKMSPRPVPRGSFRQKEKGMERKDIDSYSIGSDSRSRSGSLSSVDSSDLLQEGRGKFEKVFDVLLMELEPVCTAEQEFVQKFFDFTLVEPEVSDPSSSTIPLDSSDGAMSSKSASSRSLDSTKIMQGLFNVLETELQSFIHFADRLDNFLKKQIEDMKIQKTKKCGILPFVTKFEEFAVISESVFKNSERRADLDKAYHHLIRVVFANVERMAEEHQKTPRAVVMMENYHHLFRVLSRLKILCLENEKRDAKKKYSDSQKMYVNTMLGRPMEKLNGVQECIAAGVKEDEVGYQLAFSKQELRKCIKEYPAKELKKGLEQLYKKVEKHLCEEENLLQVVWHSMQDEFLQQYKTFDDLIQRCYPGSMINLEVTINDILPTPSVVSCLKWDRTEFNGVDVNLDQLDDNLSLEEFDRRLRESILQWRRDAKKSVWMKVPVSQSYLIPVAFFHGFNYHHAVGNYAMLLKWLPQQITCNVPPYASHQIGVAEFRSVIMFRQQHQMKNAFGKSDIYLICRMAPLSYGISKCEDEIAKCEWMNLSELLTDADTGPMTRLAARLAAQGLKNGFENVDILPNRMTSWVDPKKSVCIFHRYLPS
ncbi:Exocyst complex component 1 [Acropora cervicornis]|uniref:Exocyst complex component 1 n=1 Tax=Acropora cervicornis TaxID=6130 RepID=A0AAD9V082_ACRCE|nr:Exocyst complex component 1 [Acropora cervicornis]